MESAIDDVLEYDTIPGALADAARICLRAALAEGDDREAALHLLAADALITYACEAAANDGGDSLRELAEGWSPGSLARLIAASATA